ncbi:transcriptional repressor LexA [Patescibacteria group bacterium]|nr:transcriptional repressor LexA [Patescibacteria group bacterium]MBU4481333.1 transcriptional repressor LexA [Patescibacteria group bacterium]
MLTQKQKAVFDFVKTYLKDKEYAPSLEEIQKKFKLASVSTAHYYISKLKKAGYLEKLKNKARSISIPEREPLVKIPLLGTIAAGEPIEVIRENEFISVSKTKLPKSGEIYALRVSGNSMIDENIRDGDVVLVKQQEVAENGQRVVALIDNYEATLKKFYRERGHIRLQPANKTLEPIIIRKDRDIKIQGIVVDVITESPEATPQTLFGDYEPLKKRWTGYSIYNEDAKRRTKQNTLPTLYPKLPNQKFDIIYADPPWHYNGKLQFDKSSKSKENIDFSRKIFISSATFKYPTLKTSELMKIPVHEIARDDCLLFMWTSNPHLAQAVELGEVWGFEYKTVAFVWDKMNHNPGQYTLSNCELCLVFKRGRIPKPRGARNMQQLVRSPRKEHSEKPVEVIQAIEKMFPSQERIELFARRKTKGWSVWGLDVFNEK